MLKNRWLLIGLLLAMTACVAVAALALLLLPKPGVTKANFDCIEAGMTRADVDRIFGWSPNGVDFIKVHHVEVWEDDDSGHRARVQFDYDGRAIAASWMPSRIEEPTIWQKLRDRVHRRRKLPEVPLFFEF